MTVEYFVPLSVISFAYARIAFRLWGSKTPGAAQNERDHNILLNKKKVANSGQVLYSVLFCNEFARDYFEEKKVLI